MTDSEPQDRIIRLVNDLPIIKDTEPTPSDADSDVSDTKSPASERSQTSDSELPDIPLLMGLTYKEIKAYGLIISANNKAKITVDEIQEYLIMPSYPATKDSGSLEDPGILYFIYCSNPIGPNIDSESINAIFTKEIS
ncbi:predicted protein [Aspergillus nidulans FGSC A4]|uniref:Uncharacterized protein n=1 Tax=Emericella nidulans (strain FGSC A4 / ATCC 38163 / CBS 112.46 / NRRL 194 / M139) TaxID=227321 RepID=Q5B2H5_EMENI|nr:hypothetical protein [Aspergillus nidulans FGSC A4]EAA62205.1 predicted protein [Aspergillus nidulans FGSC A4]CBF82235.1 TPA: conserved hypothetical protein [Aspergillus nidulans FGSC A4]|eukprot:XP_662859.1 predicted protein [Aspergillus nidulans FGSC A4]